MKIASKISLPFFLATILLISVVSALFYHAADVSLRTEIRQNLSHTVELYADEVELYLSTIKMATLSASKSVVLPRALRTAKDSPDYGETLQNATRLLLSKKATDRSIHSYMLLNASGTVVASSDRTDVGENKSTDPYFLEARKGVFIKDAYISPTKKQPLMAVAAPILDDNGAFLGVLVARVTLDELTRILTSKTSMGDTGEIFLINQFGYNITPSRFEKNTPLKKRIDTENSRAALLHKDREHVAACKKIPDIFLDYRGVPVLGTHTYIPAMHWGLIAKIDAREALEPVHRLGLAALFIIGITPFLCWGLGLLIAASITGSLRKLHRGTEVIGAGHLDYKVGTSARDEVGQLSRAFDSMALHLKQTTVSKDYLDNIMESMDDSLIVVNPEAVIMTVNRATCELLGYEEKELIGKDVSLLFPAEEEEEEEEEEEKKIPLKKTMLKKLIEEGGLRNYELRYKAKDGRNVPILLSGAVLKKIDCPHDGPEEECPAFKANGKHCEKILGVVCVAKDITDLKRLEETLDLHKAKIDLMLKSVQMGVWTFDLVANKRIFDDLTCSLLGIDPAAFDGSEEKFFAAVHLSDREKIRSNLKSCIDLDMPYRPEYRVIWPDGSLHYIAARGQLIRDDHGKPTMVNGVLWEITELKKMEAALIENQERTHFALESSHLGAWDLNLEDQTAFRTAEHDRIFGYEEPLPQWTYETFLGHVLPEDRPEVDRKFQKAIKEQSNWNFECRILRRDGAQRWIQARGQHLRDAKGRCPHMAGIVQDITERKISETETQRNELRLQMLVAILQHPSQTIQDFLDHALEQALRLTESKLGYIYHYHEDRKQLFLNTWSKREMAGCPVTEPQTCYAWDKAGIWGETVRQRRPLVVNDFQTAPPLAEGAPLGHVPLSRFMTVPIFSGDKIVAVVGLANKASDYEAVDVLQVSLMMEVVWKVMERKEAEEALSNQAQYNRSLLENAMDVISILDAQGIIRYESPSFEKLFGYKPEEVLGKNGFEFLHPEDLPRIARVFSENIPIPGTTATLEMRFRHKDGHWVTIESVCKNLVDDPLIQGVVINSRDITDRKHAEEALAFEQMFSSALLENMNTGVVACNGKGELVLFNRVAREWHGLDAENTLPQTEWARRYDLYAEDGVTPLDDRTIPLSRAFRGEWVHKAEMVIAAKDKPKRYVVAEGAPIKAEDGRIFGAVVVMHDITARRKTEILFRESEERYRSLVDNVNIGISLISPNMEILTMNEQMKKWFPQIDISQKPLCYRSFNTPPREDLCPYCPTCLSLQDGKVHEALTDSPAGDQVRHYRVASTPIKDEKGKVIAATEIVEDITEQLKSVRERELLQRQLAQAQKMEAIGTMASGIAHNFNNILASIRGSVDMTIWDTPPESTIHKNLVRIVNGVESAQKLTAQMMAFSRKHEERVYDVSIVEIVEQTLALFKASIKGNVEVRENLDPHCGLIKADPNQLQHVILNLLTNAYQAIDGPNGVIEVSLSALRVGAPQDERYMGLCQGGYVKLSIKDTGCGMDRRTLDHIFEPFFTTKEVGKGTGLGLSMVHGIISRYGGKISVESEPGKGSTFHLFLASVDPNG